MPKAAPVPPTDALFQEDREVSVAQAMPATYEAALQELEQLVGALESGQLPLDELLGSYRRGAALLEFCRGKLQAVEDQIKVLDAGNLKAWTTE
ncbi:exodeoxyribonuclease VII small subunit [Variovorax dokdonensis]